MRHRLDARLVGKAAYDGLAGGDVPAETIGEGIQCVRGVLRLCWVGKGVRFDETGADFPPSVC